MRVLAEHGEGSHLSYEWRLEHGRKQPYYFHRRNDWPLFFAGTNPVRQTRTERINQFFLEALCRLPFEIVSCYGFNEMRRSLR
jgi:hypothetical protein